MALASLTACGDKNNNTTEPTGGVVHSVTVTPSSGATVKVGGTFQFGVSVDADAGVTDRTVTWASGNTAIATVDPATGLVTGKTAGTTSITATSKANTAISGAATITVTDTTTGGGTGAPATVTISSINTTVCNGGNCSSVPATLSNIANQLDVTLNVDPGSANLKSVDLLLNCGAGDVVVATQTLASGNVAPVAEAAQAPITLSFNTAAFDSTTGAAKYRNGTCSLKGRATTTAGTTVSTGTPITLANQDVIVGNLSSTKQANDATGLLWHGGDVTVTATPVFYSTGHSAATTQITYEGKTQTVTNTNGTVTATFTDGNGANNGGATDINNKTDANSAATLTVSVIDNTGNNMNSACGNQICSTQSVLAGNATSIFPATTPFRLDTQSPNPGTFALANNTDQNTGPLGYIGTGFRFATDSAAGYRGPNATAGNQTRNLDNVGGTAGVDRVTVTFLEGTCTTCSASSTYTPVTSTSTLSESATSNAYVLLMVTTDALGNADTTYADGSAFTAAGSVAPAIARFGVDVTAPTLKKTSGPSNLATAKTIGGTGSYVMTISDNLSGPNPKQLVAQTVLANISASTAMPAEGTVFTNGSENLAGPCVIGRYNKTAAAAGANALPLYARDGTALGFCTPVPYTLAGGSTLSANVSGLNAYATTEIIGVDQAGNQTAPFTSEVVEDAVAPAVTNVDLPQSITGNSTVSFASAVTENLDVTGSYGTINYATPTNGAGAINLQYATTTGPGTAFDNVLTRSTTANPTIPNFIKNLQVSTGGAVVAPAAGGNATAIVVTAMDEAGNTGSLSANFSPSVSFSGGASSTFDVANFTQGFTATASKTTLSDCPAAGCTGGATAANPTSTTITATAAGVSGTFSNPFASGQVGIWYQVTAGGNWFFAGNAGAGSARDNGTNRFWDYTFTFTPPATAPDGTVLTGGANINVMAVGVNANGDAVATQPVAITLTNP